MGVDIEVITPGNGTTFPITGNKVTCHYILTLKNGKKVDSSRDRGKPFEFNVGRGEVIAGWDEALTKMSLGERAKLTISAVSFCFHTHCYKYINLCQKHFFLHELTYNMTTNCSLN